LVLDFSERGLTPKSPHRRYGPLESLLVGNHICNRLRGLSRYESPSTVSPPSFTIPVLLTAFGEHVNFCPARQHPWKHKPLRLLFAVLHPCFSSWQSDFGIQSANHEPLWSCQTADQTPSRDTAAHRQVLGGTFINIVPSYSS